MRALTIQNPWAWAIFHGKNVENRTQLFTHRGPLAIHAGLRWSGHGARSELVQAAWRASPANVGIPAEHLAEWHFPRGAILGVVDLVDVHPFDGCCAPWGENGYTLPTSERPGRRITHLVLENPRLLPRPIPCVGALGLWTVHPAIAKQLEAA